MSSNIQSINTKLKNSHRELVKTLFEGLYLQLIDLESQTEELKVKINLTEKARNAQPMNALLIENESKAKKEYLRVDAENSRVLIIDALLPQFENSISNIEVYYESQSINTKERDSLTHFIEQLTEKKIDSQFTKSQWVDNPEQARVTYENRVEDLRDQINKAEALLKFSNIEDTESIAHWAINNPRELTLDEESLLVKYQELIISNPVDHSKKYLPNPNLLFGDIIKATTEQDGFWISLNGVHEYVPYVKRQFLNSNNVEQKKEFFKSQYVTATGVLEKASQEKQREEAFFKRLNEIVGLEGNISLFQRKAAILEFKTVESLNVYQSDFKLLLESYRNRESIKEQHTQSNQIWEDAKERLIENSSSIKYIEGIADVALHINSLNERINAIRENLYSTTEKIDRMARFLAIDQDELESVSEMTRREVKESSLVEKTRIKSGKEIGHRKDRLKGKQEIRTTNKALEKLVEEFTIVGYELPKSIPAQGSLSIKFESLDSNYNEATTNYLGACKAFIEMYLPQDSYKYDNESDWRKLARAALPGVFKNPNISEEEFTTEIEEKLKKIIDANTVISDRKVQTLINIFDQVEAAFSDFAVEVNGLKTFFNGNDKRITGGYKVSLKLDASTEYPISWITEFKKQIRQEVTNRTGIFKIVDDNIHFKDIIQKAFRECGGKKQAPAIKDLLNPKKYFELSFKLEKENFSSSGSTGQVYSALALLCIARISLLERSENPRDNRGIRFMPIDEAEGLGSNYEMLSNIAKSEDYQIVSMSINPVGEFEEGSHYIYMLNEPEDEEIRINGSPFAQFTEDGLVENLEDFIYTKYDGKES